jgi:hypothetical protein
MNELILQAFNLSATATGALVSAVWQGALLSAAVFLVLRMLPGLSAAARSLVWLNVFILLALLHILPVLTSPGSLESAAIPPAGSHAISLDPRWSLAVASLWLAMSLYRLVQLGMGAIHLRRIGRNAVPVPAAAEIQPLLLHNGHRVELCVSTDVARPSVLGFFRPRVLVPPALLEELSIPELRQVILHEMEHLHRGDDWTNLLQKVALVFFPLNPALAWVERRLCAERELACDDRVLNAGSGRKAYALCLAHLAEFALVKRGFSLVLGAWERRPELVQRVHRILSEPVRQMGRSRARMAMCGLTVGALACTLALSHTPEIVRFSPLARTAQAQNVSAGLDVHEVARALGGTPQLARAVVPDDNKPQIVHKPAQCHRQPRPEPTPVLADLTAPPPPEVTRDLVVMTEWNDEMTARFVVAMSNTQHAPAAAMVRCAYAVVRTPEGWLVIKI